MTKTMKYTLRVSTLVALSAMGACTDQPEEADYRMGDLEADVEDGIDHLGRTVGAERVAGLSRSDRETAIPDEIDVSDDTIRDELIEQVRTLAKSEECTVKGAIMGDYADGQFHGTAIQNGRLLTAVFRGTYEAAEGRPGGTFDGGYIDLERSKGILEGTFLSPGMHDSGPLGTFTGSWEENDRDSDRVADGNIGGVWLGLDRADGGVFLGYWSSCGDTDRPVSSTD